MAEQYDNTNRGQIWRNEKKTEPNHADFTGSVNVDGVEYWVNAWKRKEGANEKAPALSFSVKRKEGQGNAKPQQKAAPKQEEDNSIPF